MRFLVHYFPLILLLTNSITNIISSFIPLPTKKYGGATKNRNEKNRIRKRDLWGMVLSSFKNKREVATTISKTKNDIDNVLTDSHESNELGRIKLLDVENFQEIIDENNVRTNLNENLLQEQENIISGGNGNHGDELSRKKPLGIIIAGAPASGKGTQCERIKDTYGLVHLSTGDMLREAVKAGTTIGKIAKEYMDQGKLVPDELIINLVKERIQQNDCRQNGWLLDGFPRTKAQANSLTLLGIKPDLFIYLKVPDTQIITRTTGRRIDANTGKIYHLTFNPPPHSASLIHRSDDTMEKIVVRLKQFHDNFNSVRECYENVMVEVDGDQRPEVVERIICLALDESRDRILITS